MGQGGGCLQGCEDFPGYVPLEAADDLSFGQPLGGPPGQLIAGRLMPAQADHHDAVPGRVGLAVATSVQAVPHGFP